MKPKREELYKAACRISRRLQNSAESDADNAQAMLLAHYEHLEQSCLAMARQLARVRHSADRRWLAARDRSIGIVKRGLDPLFEQVKYLVYRPPDPFSRVSPPPRVDLILGELRQLREEFGNLRIDKQVIAVTTESIHLQDVRLGPFSIELNLDRMNGRPDSHCFDCIAVEPNPASTNDMITHPHVDDGQLCAGDAATPIRVALSEARLCEAFLLVAAVLRHYNAGSPYVALEHWDGYRCPDCDRIRDPDDMDTCGACNRRVCNDCSGCCGRCQEYFCQDCLERDRVAREELCPSCRHTCCGCGRVVSSGEFVQEVDLCPQCHAAQRDAQAAAPAESANAEGVGETAS